MNNQTITAGAILSASWGYDQTNIDFFKVTKVQNGWAWIQPIGQEIVEHLPHMMGEKVIPNDEPRGKVMRRKIRNWSREDYVSVFDYEAASVWSGQPQLQTHTH